MPFENRTLAFDSLELAEALTGHSAVTKKPFPSGIVVSVELEEDPKPVIKLTLQDYQIARKVTVAMEPEQMAAALIHYCKVKKVPLPRRSRKSLHVEDGRVLLKIIKEK
ncbi:MAG: hypothetical protein GVY13_01565 [Alphaproteobacteria bacterium]|jgi:hypothetical protein|nr:hypothetical protein [Alphaproteobacteria bacterium]